MKCERCSQITDRPVGSSVNTEASIQEGKAADRSTKRDYGTWFSLPTIAINLSIKALQKIDAYEAHKDQFIKVPASNPIEIIAKGKIQFHVIGYDNQIFDTNPEISASHILKYKVNSLIRHHI